MAITTFIIQGYRSLQSLRLHLTKINVITGANGCGKSNLYKSLYLLSRAIHGDLAKTLAQEGGMPSILWAGEKKSSTKASSPVRWVLHIKTDSINYLLACGLPTPSLSLFSLDPLVKEEYLWLGDKRRPSNTLLERKANSAWFTNQEGERQTYPVGLSQSESILSQLKAPHLYPELFFLCDEIKKWRFYHHFRTDSDSPIRFPQIGVRTPILSHDGHDLAAALQTILEVGDHELLHNVIDRAFPGATLSLHVDHKTCFEVQLKIPGIIRPLTAKELSDGTLRYLCLIAALLSPRPAPLLALNEPEMSLHPDLLTPLAELIKLASRRSQIWITTHSATLTQLLKEIPETTITNLISSTTGTQIEGLTAWEQLL